MAEENRLLALRIAALEAARPVSKPLQLPKRSRKTAVHVYKLLAEYFDEEELDLLAFDCDADGLVLSGSRLSRAKALVEFVWNRGELQHLILLAQEQRPGVVEWPVLPGR